jgi:hypothetical protein
MTGGDEDDGGDVEYEKVVENAHGALLSEGGDCEGDGRTERVARPDGLANADGATGYSHAATEAYEEARKSKRREVTRGHGQR